MNKIYYVGAFSFPEGDAGAARVLNVGKALRELNYEVVFGGWQEESPEAERRADGSSFYQGFRYYSLNEFRQTKLNSASRLFHYLLRGGKTVQWLAAQGLSNNDCVIAYGGASAFLLRLRSLCRERGASLISDCVEWYEPKHLVGGRFGLARWDQELKMRYVNKRAGKIIAISTYLEKYYKAAGCGVIRIPPLVDIGENKWQPVERPHKSDNCLNIAYAGSPGKKDLLGNILEGVALSRKNGNRVQLNLIGPSPQDAASCLEPNSRILNELEGAITFCGRIPQSKVPAFLQQSDFSVLLRPNERYARAGFPTKIVESLAAGVPVIANPTGDIAQFVGDGEEGILLPDPSAGSFVLGIQRILEMPPERRMEMGLTARRRAVRNFHYQGFVPACRDFFADRQ